MRRHGRKEDVILKNKSSHKKLGALRRVVVRRNGNTYIEAIIAVCLLFSIIATFLFLPPVYAWKQNVDTMARKLVRAVEVSGEINADIDALYTRLSDELGIHPTITWEATYIGDTKKIQLRDTFRLTLSSEYPITIFEPTFSDPVQVKIPITVTLTGVSEVYHK